MAAGPKLKRRVVRRLCVLIAVAAATSLALGTLVNAGEPADPSSPEESVRFYSTAAPPPDYPGPVPESSALEDEPAGDAIPSDAADPPTADPLPTPPAPSPEPVAEPPITSEESNTTTVSNEVEVVKPEAETSPEPESMRLASTAPVDRVPDPTPGPVTNAPDSDPISVALAAIAACKSRYESVRDYTCTFIKRERIDGRLSGYEVLSMKARTSPMSVYFKFKQPNEGREAIYVHGRNDGKAIVHDVGIGRIVAGSLHLDPRSRRAMNGNRHPITEAGIGFMIDSLLEGWHREMTPLDSVVTIREGVLVNKRPATLIVCNHPKREPHFVFHEVRLFIDHEHGLPIRFEAYDWPRRAGEAAPLVEEYTYTDLRLNAGLSEKDFDPSNKAYSFGRF